MRGTAAALAATVFVAAASATIPSVWPAELGQYNKSLHDASYILAIHARHCTFFRTGVQFAEVGASLVSGHGVDDILHRFLSNVCLI